MIKKGKGDIFNFSHYRNTALSLSAKRKVSSEAPSSSLDWSLSLLPVETLRFCFLSAPKIKEGQRCPSMGNFLSGPATQKLSLGSPLTPHAAKIAGQQRVFQSGDKKDLERALNQDLNIIMNHPEIYSSAL